MARSANPLERGGIDVAQQLPGARLQAPRTNAALDLADALKDATPEARQFAQGIAEDQARKSQAQARQDALHNEGAALSDAVRSGKIDATQNPWYIKAYNRESASITSLDALQKLQTESASWESYNDPDKFASDWREKVGKLTEGYTTSDQQAGFQAAESQVSSQVLQENVARNIARIKAERVQNVGALSTDALQSVYRQNGGVMSPNEAVAALQASGQQWFATGGSEQGWHEIVVGAVDGLARATGDSSLFDLLKAPELMHGPSASGDAKAGVGSLDHSDYDPPHSQLAPAPIQAVDPDAPSGAAPAVAPPRVQVTAPATKLRDFPLAGGFRLSSAFGARSAPKAGASTNHRGMDLAVPVGTPLQAQATGKVISARDEGKLGNTVRVDYGNGVVAIYGHLSSMDVKPGDIVAAGQEVAKSGQSGNVTGAHVHYQLMVNGKATNPATYKGSVGGTFEGDQQAAEAPTFKGFPSQTDQPFQTTGVTPANVLNRGPSLYGLPGVAEKVEQARFYVDQAAQNAPLQRAKVIQAKRQARGYEASDVLWQKYGTGLMTGSVTRDQIIATLGDKYSGPEIAEAMQQVSSVLRDSVSVANAQVAARGQNPGKALEVLEIASDAARSGWSPGLESRVSQAVLSGDISGDDAKGIIGTAVARANTLKSQDRAEQREDLRLEEAGGMVRTAAGLRQSAANLKDLVLQSVSQVNPTQGAMLRSPKAAKAVQDSIQTAMGAYMASHPGDYQGALQAGKDAANKMLQQAMFKPQPATAGPKAPAGGNPRRSTN